MHAERAIPVEATSPKRGRWLALAASILLHLALIAALYLDAISQPPPPPAEELPVEVVFVPPEQIGRAHV